MSLAALLASSVRISMPYASGALGGTLSERGGVVNIALEGLMLSGAFAYVATSWALEKHLGPVANHATLLWFAPLAGLAAAMLTGLALAAVHAIATVTFKADHIISGLAINIFALGATNFLLKHIWDSSSNSERCLTFASFKVFDPQGSLAFLNSLMHPLVWLIVLLFVAAQLLLYRTRFGLRLRSVGENPAASDSLGVNVEFYRYGGVLLGGVAASLGGVWLASEQGLFSSAMTNGRGYIALAAMIIGKWRPWGVAAACLIFGGAEALQNQLQIYKQAAHNVDPHTLGALGHLATSLPTQLIQAFPYLLTIVVIAGLIGRSTPPAADGIAYEKGRE